MKYPVARGCLTVTLGMTPGHSPCWYLPQNLSNIYLCMMLFVFLICFKMSSLPSVNLESLYVMFKSYCMTCIFLLVPEMACVCNVVPLKENLRLSLKPFSNTMSNWQVNLCTKFNLYGRNWGMQAYCSNIVFVSLLHYHNNSRWIADYIVHCTLRKKLQDLLAFFAYITIYFWVLIS